MLGTLYRLFSGVVIVATLLTALIYIWGINLTTVYERKAPSTDPHSEI